MSRLFTMQEVNTLELSAVEAERERIIKILEAEMCQKDKELVECWCGSWLEAIALIKGEQK